jgi:hypothetical protein
MSFGNGIGRVAGFSKQVPSGFHQQQAGPAFEFETLLQPELAAIG